MQGRQAQSRGPRPTFAAAPCISCTDSLLDTNSSPVDKNEIGKEVARVLDKLPRQFRRQLHNVEVVVEERPGEELFLDAGLDPEQDRFTDSTKESRCPIAPAFTRPFYQIKLQFSQSPCCGTFPTLMNYASKFGPPCCTRSPTTSASTTMTSTSWGTE